MTDTQQPVAWMYTGKVTGTVRVWQKREPMPDEDWTETPLYAAPQSEATDARDAARYRWLRQFPTDTQQFGRRYWLDELDAAIDSAMQGNADKT